MLPFNGTFLWVCFSTPASITVISLEESCPAPLQDGCHCDLSKSFLRGIHTCAIYLALVKILAHPSSRCLEEKSLYHTKLLTFTFSVVPQ